MITEEEDDPPERERISESIYSLFNLSLTSQKVIF